MTKIVPAILAKNFVDFKKQVRFFEKNFSFAQIDVMDGKFVKNKTFFDFKKINKIKTRLNYEIHLMVKNPYKLIQKALKYSKVKKIIFHIESVSTKECFDLIKLIKKNKKQAGLALNPSTDLRKVKPFLSRIDYLLVMGVEPGWSGQKLMSKIYKRIRKIKKIYSKLKIGVDGGVNEKNAKFLIEAGAEFLNSASYLLNSKDVKSAIKKLKQ